MTEHQTEIICSSGTSNLSPDYSSLERRTIDKRSDENTTANCSKDHKNIKRLIMMSRFLKEIDKEPFLQNLKS